LKEKLARKKLAGEFEQLGCLEISMFGVHAERSERWKLSARVRVSTIVSGLALGIRTGF